MKDNKIDQTPLTKESYRLICFYLTSYQLIGKGQVTSLSGLVTIGELINKLNNFRQGKGDPINSESLFECILLDKKRQTQNLFTVIELISKNKLLASEESVKKIVQEFNESTKEETLCKKMLNQ